MSWRLGLALLLTGCVHRVGKFAAPEAYLVPVVEERASEVRYTSGFRGEAERDFDPEVFEADWLRPVPIAQNGAITVRPAGGEVELWLRHPGGDRGFEQVIDRTGAIDRRVPNELRLGWPATDGVVRIPLSHLANVYGGNRLQDGDLLLVRVDGESDEDFLFRVRRFELWTRLGAGVLFRLPVPGVDGQRARQVNPSSTVAINLAFGYRPRTRSPALYWLTEQLGLVVSLGVGSTALPELQQGVTDPLDRQITGAFNAAIAGGGVEFFRMISLQAQVNLSSFLRDGSETPWAVAAGIDAVQLARFGRNAGTRLLRHNRLEDPEVPTEQP